MQYDDVIVGGGSAGAVLAARLSEEPARRVLLVEAGPDYPTLESTPADLRDGWRMSLQAHDWGMTAEAVPGRAIPYPRARVIGGSSAVNATIALRGVPADYDEWAALGNDEWSWAKVLPHFRRLEDDPEGAGELHGRGGPITIRRWRPNEWIPIQRAFFEVCRRLGFPEVTDHNHPAATGVGPFPQSRRDRLRVSTAIAYLLPARHRPNLTIRPNTLVNRITVADDRAVGVDIGAQGRPAVIRGRRITLAAGAIGSPAILLRSGVGPKAALADLGIDPVTDLPGVGAGLADHPVTRLLLVPKPASGDPDSPLAQVVLRYTALSGQLDRRDDSGGAATTWDVRDPSNPVRLTASGLGDQAISAAAISSDGRTVALAGANATVTRWDVSDPRSPRPLPGPVASHPAVIRAIAFDPVANVLATAGNDGRPQARRPAGPDRGR